MIRITIFASILAVLAGLAACGDGPFCCPEDPPPPPPPVRDDALTADAAVAQFRAFYDGRNLDFYRGLLSPEFLFVDQAGGRDGFEDEIAVANMMFNGLESDDGIIIDDIVVDRLEPLGAWTPTPDDDEDFGGFPESRRRQYLVDFKFPISDQNLILRVQGPVTFYVLDEGSPDHPDHRLLGLVDATSGHKAVDSQTWTEVRDLFR